MSEISDDAVRKLAEEITEAIRKSLPWIAAVHYARRILKAEAEVEDAKRLSESLSEEGAALSHQFKQAAGERDDARDTIQKMRAGLPLSYVKTKCKHDGSWTTYDGSSCMACDLTASQARESELRDRLKQAVEAMKHAMEWLAEDGCDCGTDEQGTCALCVTSDTIAAAESALASSQRP